MMAFLIVWCACSACVTKLIINISAACHTDVINVLYKSAALHADVIHVLLIIEESPILSRGSIVV